MNFLFALHFFNEFYNRSYFYLQSKEVCHLKNLYNKSTEDVKELRDRIESLSTTNEHHRDEIKQLTALYQTEHAAASTLEKALNTEKENFK